MQTEAVNIRLEGGASGRCLLGGPSVKLGDMQQSGLGQRDLYLFAFQFLALDQGDDCHEEGEADNWVDDMVERMGQCKCSLFPCCPALMQMI